MQYGFIHTNDAELSNLTQLYKALATAFANAEQLYRDLKTARGNCPKMPDRDNARHIELEREYEQAYLRLAAAVDTMYPLLQPVWDAAQTMRTQHDAVAEAQHLWYTTEGLIRANNVMAAENLYERGCQFYFGEFQDIRRPLFFNIRDDWKRPQPERVFVVCGDPGNERDQFVYKTPSAPYLLRSEADAEVGRSVSDSGWYHPHVYDVRQHAEKKADLERRRNPQPTLAQTAKVVRALRLVQQQIDTKPGCLELTVRVPDDDEVVVMCVAKQLRENGWEARDHYQHGYAIAELWLKKAKGESQPA